MSSLPTAAALDGAVEVRGGEPGMGQQPALDGLRAISVVAVMLYHGGFTWMHGGFLGVEVFFVISGYLITVLLIEERQGSGTVALGRFWARRARRLLPALATMLVAVSSWVAVFGSPAQVWQTRRDLPWAIGYVANWGQIVGDTPYFQPVDPPVLRHLWSLAVEEQWYLVWPVAFVVLVRVVRSRRGGAVVLAGVAAAAATTMWWIQRGGPAPLDGGRWLGWLDGSDRANVNYLSTPTRSLGLLLGASAAFAWQPWRCSTPIGGTTLDRLALPAMALLTAAFVFAPSTSGAMYPWGLAGVSLLSVGVIAAATHPGAARTRGMLGWPPLVAVGRRSYGLYLWHWPVLVLAGASRGSWPRFALAIAVSIALAEACYRLVETPIRERRWSGRRIVVVHRVPVFGCAAAMVALVAAYTMARPFDPAEGGEPVAFGASVAAAEWVPAPAAIAPSVRSSPPPGVPTTVATIDDVAAPIDAAPATPAPPPTPAASSAPTTTDPPPPPELPVDIAIVGDSQANALAINLPTGIDTTFDIRNGSVNGCSVFDEGSVVSSRHGFHNSFERCRGWQAEWADASDGADVALVVIGAWDVFDLEHDGATITFGSPGFDRLFSTNLRSGIEAMAAGGARVGLLEVPCMRPQDVKGAGVPALPERGDDARVAHLNTLLRSIALADPARVGFVTGPKAWCGNEAIATDLDYRWDGVHVYRAGAGLIFDTIAPALLTLAAGATTAHG